MFNNIGGKIKTLAKVITWIGTIASIIVGRVLCSIDDLIPVGLLVMVLGSLFAWISSFLLYGFGELVENSAIIAYKSDIFLSNQKAILSKLEKCKIQALISEEDYKAQINNCN